MENRGIGWMESGEGERQIGSGCRRITLHSGMVQPFITFLSPILSRVGTFTFSPSHLTELNLTELIQWRRHEFF